MPSGAVCGVAVTVSVDLISLTVLLDRVVTLSLIELILEMAFKSFANVDPYMWN